MILCTKCSKFIPETRGCKKFEIAVFDKSREIGKQMFIASEFNVITDVIACGDKDHEYTDKEIMV